MSPPTPTKTSTTSHKRTRLPNRYSYGLVHFVSFLLKTLNNRVSPYLFFLPVPLGLGETPRSQGRIEISTSWVLSAMTWGRLPLPLESQSHELWGASHRIQSEKRRNSCCIGAGHLSTWYKDPRLSRGVDQDWWASEENFSVARCRGSKESVCACVKFRRRD